MKVFSPKEEAGAKVRKNFLSGVTVTWTCPRCGCVQFTAVSLAELVDGATIECENTEECGLYEVSFTLDLVLGEGLYTTKRELALKVVD